MLHRSLQFLFFFFFSSRRRHTILQGDWSSDVCSSDLGRAALSREMPSGRLGAVAPIPPAPIPGSLRRLAAGAWHVPAGFTFLFRHRRLLPLAILPVLLVVVFLIAGMVLGAFVGPAVESRLAPPPGTVP